MGDREIEINVGLTLAAMEAALELDAEVIRDDRGPHFVTLSVAPCNPKARSMRLCYIGEEITLEAGEHGGRWELGRTPFDVALLAQIVESIVAGRIRETLGPRRSVVEVTLADGSIVCETGYASLLPRPGWKQRAAIVHYEAYAT